jgi:mono/diheme cytochrome c family protein
VIGGLIGWALGDQWSDSSAESFVLVATDVERGRREFQLHGCALCHVATGERALPAPASTSSGPEIGAPQAGWSDHAIARAIVDPSHDVPPAYAISRTDGKVESPMAAYSDALTVQELADLVAYIRYLGE